MTNLEIDEKKPPMKSLAIIKAHPSSDDVVLVQLPPATAPAIRSDIPHLWWDPRRTAWRMRADAVDELHAVCIRLDVALTDEREPDAPVWTGPLRHRPLPQCRWCATPARRTDNARLQHCPACGRTWDPIEVSPDELTSRATRDCPSCGHTQAAGWAYCSRCGQPIPHLAPVPVRAPPSPPPREQLPDPLSLRELIEQLPLTAHLQEHPPHADTT